MIFFFTEKVHDLINLKKRLLHFVGNYFLFLFLRISSKTIVKWSLVLVTLINNNFNNNFPLLQFFILKKEMKYLYGNP